MLSVFGGKLTTYRKLAEAALKQLDPFFKHKIGPRWTASTPLPGGENYHNPSLSAQLTQQYPWLSSATIKRYSQQYGTRVKQLLEQVTTEQDMGIQFASGVYQTEIDFLITQEFAVTAQDILWRRTKLGVSLSATSQQAICDYIKQRQSQLKSA